MNQARYLRDITHNANVAYERARKQFIDRDVILLKGQYAGRRGKITAVSVSTCIKPNFDDKFGRQEIAFRFLAQPYRQVRRGNETITTSELLWDRNDARTFWQANDLQLVETIDGDQ